MAEADTPGMDDPGLGRRLALDVGSVRIGVAVSDRAAVLATPVETVQRTTFFRDPNGEDIDRILALIGEYEPVEVIVGLPLTLKGKNNKSAQNAVDIAQRLKDCLAEAGLNVPVRLADERLTTVLAHQALRSSGRSQKKSRGVVDQAAAVEILQAWLDGRANTLRRLAWEAELAQQDAGEE